MSQKKRTQTSRSANFGLGLMIAVSFMSINTLMMGFTFYPWAKYIGPALFTLGFVLYSLGVVTPLRTFCATCLSVGGVALAWAVYYFNPLGIKGKVDDFTYLWIHWQTHSIEYLCALLMLTAGWWLGTVPHEKIFGREEDTPGFSEDAASPMEHEP